VDCYGDNAFGRADDYTGTGLNAAVGVAAGFYHTCVLTEGGNVVCYGNNDYGKAEPDLYTGGDAVGVAAGLHHTCVLTSGGNVVCYGDDSEGQDANYTLGDAVCNFVDVGLCLPGGGVTLMLPTTPVLNAADINEASLQCAGAAPSRCWLSDADGDGDEDLLCRFARSDLDHGTMSLTGETNDGTAFSREVNVPLLRCR
jgi:hypothetical protein